MSNVQLPDTRVINSAFKEKGRHDVVKIEVFPISDGGVVKLTFESAKSPWRQGVWLKTDKHILVNEQQSPSIQLWQDTTPHEVRFTCHTRDGCLRLYNIWDKGSGRESQSWTSGMLVEELPKRQAIFLQRYRS